MSKKTPNTLTAALTIMSLWAVAFTFSILFSECVSNQSDDNIATPRRTAYPRIEVYNSTYTDTCLHPINRIHAEINTNATIDFTQKDNNKWITIKYPRYAMELYCTCTPTDKSTIDEVINNRSERMALNIDGLTSEFTEIATPSGVMGKIINSPDSKVTPIQFIASDNKSWVFSGALYNNNKSTNTDSISPVINAVNRDIIHLIKTLRSDDSK